MTYCLCETWSIASGSFVHDNAVNPSLLGKSSLSIAGKCVVFFLCSLDALGLRHVYSEPFWYIPHSNSMAYYAQTLPCVFEYHADHVWHWRVLPILQACGELHPRVKGGTVALACHCWRPEGSFCWSWVSVSVKPCWQPGRPLSIWIILLAGLAQLTDCLSEQFPFLGNYFLIFLQDPSFGLGILLYVCVCVCVCTHAHVVGREETLASSWNLWKSHLKYVLSVSRTNSSFMEDWMKEFDLSLPNSWLTLLIT